MRALVLAALIALPGCALRHLYEEPLPPESEVLKARTADGWDIALIHYRPVGEERGRPVLLCHGISANARNMDLDAAHSLARFFASQGRHAFAMSLRGTGLSDFPDGSPQRPWDYNLDTFATQDAPAAIAKVKEITGAKTIDYVGHSMGGMLIYDYLARGGQDLNAVVILGSPMRFLWGGAVDRFITEWGPPVVKNVDNVDSPALAAAVMPIHGEIEGPVELLLYNPENVNPETWKKLIAVGLGTISGGVLRHLGSWIVNDEMKSADGRLDFRELLPKVKTPMFVVAGKLDRTAPVASVKAGYDLVSGPKEFFIAGEENGFAHDYGHMDMVVGDRAPRELWPKLEAFFQRYEK